MRASYASVLHNLGTVAPLHQKNLSYPGCWAYPDMLQVNTPWANAAYRPTLLGPTPLSDLACLGCWAHPDMQVHMCTDSNMDMCMDMCMGLRLDM